MAQLRLSKYCFIARADSDHPSLPTFRFYKRVGKFGPEVQVIHVPRMKLTGIYNFTHMVRGTSWSGAVVCYLEKLPGATPWMLPALLLILLLSSRASGAESNALIEAFLKAARIRVRAIPNYLMGTEGAVDVWFWILCLSLILPLWNWIRQVRKKNFDPPCSPCNKSPCLGCSQINLFHQLDVRYLG